jgi:hypothetical protein
VTKLDAASHYSSEHLDDADNWKFVQKAKGMVIALTEINTKLEK